MIRGFGGGIGGLLGGVGFAALTKGAIEAAAANETLATSFRVMTGDAATAAKLMADVTKLAGETPLETTELAGATKSLLAFGVSATEIVPSLRMLGDIASGIGAPVGELAELYGKAKVQGRLFAEDVNQLTGRGIPVIQEFAKQFGVTDSEVKKLVESGSIGFGDLEVALKSMTGEGGKFFGMMQQQSQTFAGKMSSLKDSFVQLGVAIGTELIDPLKSAIQWMTKLAEKGSEVVRVLKGSDFKEAKITDQRTYKMEEYAGLRDRQKAMEKIARQDEAAEGMDSANAMAARSVAADIQAEADALERELTGSTSGERKAKIAAEKEAAEKAAEKASLDAKIQPTGGAILGPRNAAGEMEIMKIREQESDKFWEDENQRTRDSAELRKGLELANAEAAQEWAEKRAQDEQNAIQQNAVVAKEAIQKIEDAKGAFVARELMTPQERRAADALEKKRKRAEKKFVDVMKKNGIDVKAIEAAGKQEIKIAEIGTTNATLARIEQLLGGKFVNQ